MSTQPKQYRSLALQSVAVSNGTSMDELYQQGLLLMAYMRFIVSLLVALHLLILWAVHNVDAVIVTT